MIPINKLRKNGRAFFCVLCTKSQTELIFDSFTTERTGAFAACRGASWEYSSNMAASTGHDGKAVCTSNVDVLLHPELLSEEFLHLILNEKNVSTTDCGTRDRLTELYLRHVIPLPQRTLPDNRWGRRMGKSRGRQTSTDHKSESSTNDHSKKRPLIVFDGSSSQSGPHKVKKPEGVAVSTGITDRLKPPPTANLSNPIRRLSGSTTSSSIPLVTDTANLKRSANSSEDSKSPQVKKKIQHVTWP